MQEKEVYRFSKNAGEDLVFRTHTYKGRDCFDIRVWTKRTEHAEGRQTSKGLTTALENLQDFMEGMSRINEVYYKESKITKECENDKPEEKTG